MLNSTENDDGGLIPGTTHPKSVGDVRKLMLPISWLQRFRGATL